MSLTMVLSSTYFKLLFILQTMRIIILILLSLIVCQTNTAHAHLEGVTDTHILIDESAVNIVYTVPLEFLESASSKINLSIDEIAQRAFSVTNNGVQCQPKLTEKKELEAIKSQQFIVDYICQQAIDILFLDYRFILLNYPEHQNFSHLSIAGRNNNVVFDAKLASIRIDVATVLENLNINQQEADTNESIPQLGLIESLKQSTGYFKIGVEHILFGFDHLMFLFALLLLPLRLRALLLLITSFTVAHSITLALSVLDIVNLPVLLVEAIIAFSIAYVAFENIWEVRQQKNRGSTATQSPFKRRLLITFGFGLLHGFGFSYFLKSVGLGEQILSPLLMFNLGVESGQLIAILCISPVLYFFYKYSKERTWLITTCSLLIGIVGIFWFLQRV